MSVNTEGTETTAPEAPVTSEQPRQHVESGELANGGLDLPVGQPKSDEKEAEREAHHEWHPETGNQ